MLLPSRSTPSSRVLFPQGQASGFYLTVNPLFNWELHKKLKTVHLSPLLRLHRSDVCGLAALEDKRRIPGYQELDILTSAGFQTALAATVRCGVNFRGITQQ